MLYQFIMYSNKENLMLFDIDEDDVSFPSFYSEPFHIADTKPINDYFYHYYQLRVNVLKCWYKEDSRLIYEVEVLNEEIQYDSKNIVWLHPFDYKKPYTLPEHGQWILQQWERDESRLLPWFQYGFREEIERWIERELRGNIHSIEQVRSWEKGLLLKVRGAGNNYYVKTIPPIFEHEPFVHESLPEYVPEVISIDEQKNAYIMKEIDGTLLGYSKEIQHWKITARRIAKLQKKYINNEIQIKKIVPERPIEKIVTGEKLESTIKSLQSYISNTTYQELSKSIPEVLSLVQSLSPASLLSIDHGDLFGGNVMIEDGEPLIFDWSNSSLTHPFLMVIHLIEEAGEFFSVNLSEEILEFYLREWTDYGQIDKLRNEFLTVRLLAPIYYLVVHMLYIFPSFQDNLDKKEIIDDYVTRWLNNINMIKKYV